MYIILFIFIAYMWNDWLRPISAIVGRKVERIPFRKKLYI
jgi:hypothetical protein